MHAALQVDEHGLAGRHVALGLVAGALERHGFAGHHHLGCAIGGGGAAEHQRADAIRIAEGQQAVAGDQCDHGVRTAHATVDRRHGGEDHVGRQRAVAPGALDLVRQHVDQHLGVAAGVDVAPVDVEQFLLQRRRVGEVAVVHQHDAIGRVDVERLRLFLAVCVARGGIAHLAQAHAARQRAHVARAEHVAHHAARLVHEALRALHRDDAGRVLPAMLQQQQRVVDQLVDRDLSDDADNAAHGLNTSNRDCQADWEIRPAGAARPRAATPASNPTAARRARRRRAMPATTMPARRA